MIESILLFSLGFLSAAFLAFLIAPAIQRRVVSFTENRMRATLPISPQELKAQKDMVRAEYAAENAKISQSLIAERQRTVDAQTRAERVVAASYALAAEKAELDNIRQALEEKVRELELELRAQEAGELGMRTELAAARQTLVEDAAKIKDMTERLDYLAEMFEANRNELLERDQELSHARASFEAFKLERDRAREMERSADERARMAETRLSREVNKVMSLQDRLDRELAVSARRENTLARRVDEVARLTERLKNANAQARKAVRTLKEAGIKMPLDLHEPEEEADPVDMDTELADAAEMPVLNLVEPPPSVVETLDVDALASELHAAEGAVTNQLLQETGPEHDDEMREEIASIAARMVALTAAREGENSKIRAMLDDDAVESKNGRVSLGVRASRVLHGERS
ncbi:hypothetical protein [Rhizobium sp. L1K21]|uniref:hypothetical protein n=1 Tax=Rhizobium sp. L1K21 TaxID=2954933 RepID=UPI002093FA02|nr:hypothetical protein [Rhizobium sp. L1K21]MCO6185146.1 hypothetical protein [Rhizobium sp. L1K21]